MNEVGVYDIYLIDIYFATITAMASLFTWLHFWRQFWIGVVYLYLRDQCPIWQRTPWCYNFVWEFKDVVEIFDGCRLILWSGDSALVFYKCIKLSKTEMGSFYNVFCCILQATLGVLPPEVNWCLFSIVISFWCFLLSSFFIIWFTSLYSNSVVVYHFWC